MGENYYLGLDMGTGSVGWAATDREYRVERKHGKALWGVRLFESANTAEERRGFRTSRRRLDRRNWRIRLLQELFAEEICKVDPGFFLRMKESKYYPEDKRDSGGNCPTLPYALFADENYTDKDYHGDFPTIWHLRKMLMETAQTPDVRLVYLALHHMMKHRGHFLLSGDIEEIKLFAPTFQQFVENVRNEELDFSLEISGEQIAEAENILKDKNITRSGKKSRLIKLFNATSSCEKELLTLVSGGTAKLANIFGDDALNDCERSKLSFADNDADYIHVVEDELGERFYIIASAKAVYDWSVLADILDGCASLSYAKVKTYEKHKRDLKYLKGLVKTYLSKEDYTKIFVAAQKEYANYPAYIGMTKKNGKKQPLADKRCSAEDFYAFLRKNAVAKLPDEAAKDLEAELDCGTFLPRQTTKDNSVIPYQIHLYELRKILENLSPRMPFLAENRDKIIQLFTFRIPYYVGPLAAQKAGESGKFAWAARKSDEKIYPWNFNDVIDAETSAENFIRRMTNKCTYLPGEDVLPKNSLLYSKFMVLNELNPLCLNGEKISVELKQRIFEDLFCKKRKVTKKSLENYLVREGITGKNPEISGVDGDFKSSLTAYHDFKEKLTDADLSDRDKEKIILNITLFGDDKKLLKKRLRNLFPQLTESQTKNLAKLSYNGWGRLSAKFLEDVTIPAPGTGEVWNIMSALWNTNANLMQLLGRDYGFMKEIENLQPLPANRRLTYADINELRISPSVKRQIWQTLQIVREVQKVMGSAPSRIFVEMAREKQESKRTESRKKRLEDLYRACRREEPEWIDRLCQKLERHEEHELRSDKLYLYYTQKGRCMYSGEIIELEDLWDNNKYDIDHIFPQSKTMDDSLDNRVLVKKTYNADKSDRYPLDAQIQQEMTPFWKSLLKDGLISKKKFDRLTRKTELSAEELSGFIERQIVETRQSTKAMAEILKKELPKTEIVYVKANTVSRFRQQYKFVKVRELNDLHHAKDAYLNIVVGNVYFVKFTKDAARFIRQNPGRSYNLEKMFNYDVRRDEETAWTAGDGGTIIGVRKTMGKNNILVTRKSYEVKGGLFKQQILKKGNGQVPAKGSDDRLCDINKYGGYDKASGAYFMLVKSKDKKGAEQRTIECVPLYLKERLEKSPEEMQKYLVKIMSGQKLSEPEILLPKIKTDTLFCVDGFHMWLSGRTGSRLIFKGANQLLLSDAETKELKKIIKFIQRRKERKDLKITAYDEITDDGLLRLYDCFLDKLTNTVYAKRLSAQIGTLTNGKERFAALEKEEKCLVLYEILHMFQCQSAAANLKLIGGPANAGILVMNHNITKCGAISIITQSPTGIYEKEIDLLTL